MQTDSECNLTDYSNIGIQRLFWKKTCLPRYLLCQYIYQYSFKCTKTLKKSGSSEEWLSGYRCNEGLCYAIRIGQS